MHANTQTDKLPEPVAVRLPAPLLAEVLRIAAAEERPVSHVLRRLVRDAIEQRSARPGGR